MTGRGTGYRAMRDWLERLLEHLEWSNHRALESIVRAGVDGSGEEGIRLMAHVLGAEQVWLERLRTGDSSGLEIWPELTAYECSELMEKNVREFRRVLAGTDEEGLRRPVIYQNSSGEEFRTPLAEILLHVFLHGEHHRGQIARELRRGGDEPTNTDLITLARGRPLSFGSRG